MSQCLVWLVREFEVNRQGKQSSISLAPASVDIAKGSPGVRTESCKAATPAVESDGHTDQSAARPQNKLWAGVAHTRLLASDCRW